MNDYQISIVTNIISWPAICAAIAVGPTTGAVVAVGVGLYIARLVAR